MIRVGYDEQVFLAQQRGGISRYIVNLVSAFAAAPELGIDPVAGWRWTSNAHANEAGLSRPLRWLDKLPALVPGSRSLAALGETGRQGGYFLANAKARAAARGAGVLHHTYTHPRFLHPGFEGLRVCTVYDMIPELYPGSFSGRNPHLSKADYVAASDVLICISESTRRDLIEVYGDPGVPMPVTYLGVDPGFRPGAVPQPGLPERFLLFVGRRSGYKDFAVLAEAFAALAGSAEGKDVSLVAVGGGRFTEAEAAQLDRWGIADRVKQIEATDAQLPSIYGACMAFVFPSRHEGFGLPTLEAMACGVPAVLADSSSHPEVGGDVARYFPPGDVAALSAVLAELVGDAALRSRLGEQGIQRAAGFTWAHTARATAEVYRTYATDSVDG